MIDRGNGTVALTPSFMIIYSMQRRWPFHLLVHVHVCISQNISDFHSPNQETVGLRPRCGVPRVNYVSLMSAKSTNLEKEKKIRGKIGKIPYIIDHKIP